MHEYQIDIEKATLENTNYRKVLFTGKKLQLVVMSLKPQEDIPKEKHEDTDQFIRVESGNALVSVEGKDHHVKDDDVVIVPAGSTHYVKNTGTTDLKIYTIYTPPEHAPGTIQKTRAEALKAHH